MPGQSSDDLLALFDTAPLNRRYWVAFILLSALFVLEFFDFLVVGYLLAVLAPQWHLTYGESAVILYSGGVGRRRAVRSARLSTRPRGGVVTQRTANPRTPVRFRAWPPPSSLVTAAQSLLPSQRGAFGNWNA